MTYTPKELADLRAHWENVLAADGLAVINVSGDGEYMPGLVEKAQTKRLHVATATGTADFYTLMEQWAHRHRWTNRGTRVLWVAVSRGETLRAATDRSSVAVDDSDVEYRKWHERMVRVRQEMMADFLNGDELTLEELHAEGYPI